MVKDILKRITGSADIYYVFSIKIAALIQEKYTKMLNYSVSLCVKKLVELIL